MVHMIASSILKPLTHRETVYPGVGSLLAMDSYGTSKAGRCLSTPNIY